MHYTLIFCSYILFTIDDITSCMYCGVHVGAPDLFLKPGVTSFHLRVFLGLSNPQGQRQTSTISIRCDNFGEGKDRFNLEMSRTTQMQLYKCIHVP
jgi:hypothetical protein